MKYTINQIAALSGSFEAVKKSKEEFKSATAKGGYWLGRLEKKCSELMISVNDSRNKQIKEFGIPVMKEEKGKQIETGEFRFEGENMKKFNESVNELYKQEEEISFCPFEFETFDGSIFPQYFWSALTPFVKEPK